MEESTVEEREMDEEDSSIKIESQGLQIYFRK